MYGEKCTAIVLAAGDGKRMNSDIKKHFLLLKEKPILCYSLQEFQKADWINEIVVVVGEGEIEQCREEIIEKYNFTKVSSIAEGGKERYESVTKGLSCISACDYVFIHDGERPFINQQLLQRVYEGVREHQACVPGMPAKDTVKVVNSELNITGTIDRRKLYILQSPQTFEFSLIKEAYDKLLKGMLRGNADEAEVAEEVLGIEVKIVEGDYDNINITTPEDMELARLFLEHEKNEKI